MISTRAGHLIRAGGLVAPRSGSAAELVLASHGDSLTRDRALANYIFQLRALIHAATGDHGSVAQRGVNGISWDFRWEYEPQDTTLILDAPSSVDPARSETVDSWLVAWAGSNGMAIGGHSAADEYADLQTYVSARVSAGWEADKIVVPTMLPRTGFSETQRGDYNALIAADGGVLGYRVARLDLDGDIGGAGDEANATYYYDGVHLTDAGHAIVAGILYDVMFP